MSATTPLSLAGKSSLVAGVACLPGFCLSSVSEVEPQRELPGAIAAIALRQHIGENSEG